MIRTHWVIQVARLLMWGPKTRAELAAQGVPVYSMESALRAFADEGLIYVCEWRHTGRNPSPVYAWQAKPFERADVPKPQPKYRRRNDINQDEKEAA